MTASDGSIQARGRYRAFLALIVLTAAGLAGALILLVRSWEPFAWSARSPEQVTRDYITRVYARDYPAAYDLIASADKQQKSREVYLQENRSFTGPTLDLAYKLASFIEIAETEVEIQGERALVRVSYSVPDGNTPAVREILSAASRNSDLPPAEREDLLRRLEGLHAEGRIPAIEGAQTFQLVRERGGWRIVENWADAIRVHFSGEVKGGLPWEFAPAREVVLAKPGETLHMTYVARNTAGETITAKARHIDRPDEHLDYFQIIQCFCFIRQTLDAGEEVELPLVFRVAWDVPREVTDFYVHYEFYPLDSFPED